jgi:glycosyltransferase involved in cell wall biosynthesis
LRFHVVSLPHTQTTMDYTVCAFTEKVRKFCIMMKNLGHTVYLYAGDQNEAPCDELIPCITEAERAAHVGDKHFIFASFDYNLPVWRKFNDNVIAGIKERAEPHDFICVIGGLAHKQVADAFPNMLTVEFGIGYGGTFAKYRVWESYAWMHTCYGSSNRNPNDLNGHFYDAVIPSYFEPELFPPRYEKDDYFLFVGRLTERKGYQIAADVCEHLGERLVIAGWGTPPTYGEYVGVVGATLRASLMAGARALFVPTLYIEPFGSVACEAMMCGTPVISTDWGAFTETVVHGETGFRCRTFGEFCEAARNVENLNPRLISHYAQRYSLDRIGPRYEAYFERLSTLWRGGWYEGRDG